MVTVHQDVLTLAQQKSIIFFLVFTADRFGGSESAIINVSHCVCLTAEIKIYFSLNFNFFYSILWLDLDFHMWVRVGEGPFIIYKATNILLEINSLFFFFFFFFSFSLKG